jgi:DNA-binding NarL/FixJ family response regulator
MSGSGDDKRTAAIRASLPLWVAALSELAERSDLRVVGSASDFAAALALIEQQRPDVFITDIDVDDGEFDLEIVRSARRIDTKVRVVVLSRDDRPTWITAAFAAGVDLYARADADPADLSVGIRQLFNPSIFVAADWMLPTGGQQAGVVQPLTPREAEILRLVAEGHTNGALASMLSVTEQTIKFHLSNVYRKLQVSNRTEASCWAQVNGLIPPTDSREEAVAAAFG